MFEDRFCGTLYGVLYSSRGTGVCRRGTLPRQMEGRETTKRLPGKENQFVISARMCGVVVEDRA